MKYRVIYNIKYPKYYFYIPIKVLGLGNGYVIMSQNSRYLSPLHRSQEGENRSKEEKYNSYFCSLTIKSGSVWVVSIERFPSPGGDHSCKKSGEFSYSALTVHTWLPHGRNLTPF